MRNHPELKDSQIMRLVGTTKPTIAAIRERTHWNSPNLQPQDPVTLGLCTQIDLDNEVQEGRAAPRAGAQGVGQAAGEGRHAAADVADDPRPRAGAGRSDVDIMLPKAVEEKPEETAAEEEARVFARLREMGGGTKTDEGTK